jgi:hypothetical protein
VGVTRTIDLRAIGECYGPGLPLRTECVDDALREIVDSMGSDAESLVDRGAWVTRENFYPDGIDVYLRCPSRPHCMEL